MLYLLYYYVRLEDVLLYKMSNVNLTFRYCDDKRSSATILQAYIIFV